MIALLGGSINLGLLASVSFNSALIAGWSWFNSGDLLAVGEEEKNEDIIVSCLDCGAIADYDTPCPNGCDPLGHYISNCSTPVSLTDEEQDVLDSISLSEVIELIKVSIKTE